MAKLPQATPADPTLAEPATSAEAQTRLIAPALMLALQAAVFMVSAEARVISPLLPAIAGEFSTTVPAVGLLITAYAIPYGLFQLVYGPLADRFSRQRVMGVAISLFALGTLASGFAPSLLALDLLRLCSGAAAAGVIPVALAYVGDAVPYVDRQAALGKIVSVASLGGVLSTALGGIVAEFVSWRSLFVGYGVLALLVGALLLRLPVQRARAGRPVRRGLFGPYLEVFRQAGARAFALYGLVLFEGFAATSTIGFLGALLFERDHLSYAVIGGLLMLNGVASVLVARFVGRMVARIGERGMLLLGGSMLTVAYLVVGLQPMALFFSLGVILMGAGFVTAHSTLQTRATELVPELRGTSVALFAFSLFLGGGVGTAVAGFAIERAGYNAALLGTALLLAIFTAVSGPLLRAGQPPSQQT